MKLIQDRPALIFFGIFSVVLGPLCEELAFRGFLMPLPIRSFGVCAGYCAGGASVRGTAWPEYAWSWQYVVLIGLAGRVFGVVRYKTGSTARSAAHARDLQPDIVRGICCKRKGLTNMVETIQWTDDGVVMIDQTRLPREEMYVTCRTYTRGGRRDPAHGDPRRAGHRRRGGDGRRAGGVM